MTKTFIENNWFKFITKLKGQEQKQIVEYLNEVGIILPEKLEKKILKLSKE